MRDPFDRAVRAIAHRRPAVPLKGTRVQVQPWSPRLRVGAASGGGGVRASA